MKTKVYQDKIYAKLENNKVRDRIINGQLRRDDCNSEDVFEFLSLLQYRSGNMINEIYQPITEIEWIKVVKKSKRLSISLIFLKRNYAIYKLVIHSEIMTKILVQYYNVIV